MHALLGYMYLSEVCSDCNVYFASLTCLNGTSEFCIYQGMGLVSDSTFQSDFSADFSLSLSLLVYPSGFNFIAIAPDFCFIYLFCLFLYCAHVSTGVRNSSSYYFDFHRYFKSSLLCSLFRDWPCIPYPPVECSSRFSV